MPPPALAKLGRHVILLAVAIGVLLSLSQRGTGTGREHVPQPDAIASGAVAALAVETTEKPITSPPAGDGSAKNGKIQKGRDPGQASSSANRWTVFASDVFGVNTCSIATDDGDRKIVFSMMEGNKLDVFIDLGSPTWNLTRGKKIDVSLNIDKRTPVHVEAKAGKSDALSATASGRTGVAVLDGLLKGSTLVVSFFNPTEPRWIISLKGSKDAMVANYLCMAEWQKMSK